MKSNFLKMVVPASLLVTTFLSGCGEYQKDPVSDLSTLREDAKVNAGPNKPRVITNNVIVKEQVAVPYAESKVDDKFVIITADSNMSFSEGTSSSFEVRARVLLSGVKIKLTGQGLPEGATLVPSAKEADLYILTWKPALYTVPQNVSMKKVTIKLVADVASSENKENAEKLKGLYRESSLDLLVLRNQEAPANLTVAGLSNQVAEGQLVPFTVTATIPGIDGQAPQKPRLVISYDGVSISAGNEFLELDGSRYVIADMNKKEPKYLGDSKWQFSLLFDTKNISIQPQLAKNGSIMTNADGTRVRLSFKAYSPAGMSSPEHLVQLKLAYNLSMSAPKFEVLGLGQQGLAVSRGENVSLKFRVVSADVKAETKLIASGSALPGEPKVNCVASVAGANIQDCTMTWAVPCDAAKDQLTGYVDMKAQATSESRQSEATAYSLKVMASTKEKSLCTKPVVKVEATPTPTPEKKGK